MTSSGTIAPSLAASPIVFARNLFRAINVESPMVNMVISPAAARSAMTLVFMAASGKSADELRSVIILGVDIKEDIAKRNADFWSKECVCSDHGVGLRLATRIYVKDDQKLRPEFNLQAVEFFNAQADALNFTNNIESMKEVNKWLEKQTFHTVRNLLTPVAFNPETSVILVNSLYFRAKWSKRFPMQRTVTDDFWINSKQRMEIPMMRQVGHFRYGESRKLRSKILQLPFDESDISMLIILPTDVNGLADLEAKLEYIDLNEVATKSLLHDVDVQIPKFQIECDVDLKVPLQKMGVTRIFEPNRADLTGLFAKQSNQVISEARHKINLGFNENGCEVDIENKPGPTVPIVPDAERKIFRANRPFIFAIRNNQTVYFVGHFIKP
ncbi:uncharacterized protein Dwil_GK20662, isoform B [Drosophila willistoni]|uniref:Uncharacterized protein, isoform A n=1 Tax=Drosophila willistoni TaxID=7260 RepID=B4MK74_DROWI|nr:serine protease inhibitor 42Dd [Drosophila willistoni]EDW72513.1 uncharacterized protein Dwil_GK20662, isoform A [Drosophila willistoni]KRF97588.1 uncharacterized protein Dwil_GK20662, isoform B [Drosophila willistoni]